MMHVWVIMMNFAVQSLALQKTIERRDGIRVRSEKMLDNITVKAAVIAYQYGFLDDCEKQEVDLIFVRDVCVGDESSWYICDGEYHWVVPEMVIYNEQKYVWASSEEDVAATAMKGWAQTIAWSHSSFFFDSAQQAAVAFWNPQNTWGYCGEWLPFISANNKQAEYFQNHYDWYAVKPTDDFLKTIYVADTSAVMPCSHFNNEYSCSNTFKRCEFTETRPNHWGCAGGGFADFVPFRHDDLDDSCVTMNRSSTWYECDR